MNIKDLLIHFERPIIRHSTIAVLILAVVGVGAFFIYDLQKSSQSSSLIANLSSNKDSLQTQLAKATKELEDFKNVDQVKKNRELEEEIKKINETYKQIIAAYEGILDLKELTKKENSKFNDQFTKILSSLSERNYSSAAATLDELNKSIKTESDKIASSNKPTSAPAISANAPANNTPPSAGFSRQKVQTGLGDFTVDIVSADLNSNKVIVDTASDGDCRDNCPTLALADFVSRSGAFAGINGPFFCPASYPSCAGKTNSFDTLLMNKNKFYFNSDNNVYSTVPAAIFYSGGARFVSQTLQWGRDTSVDAVIANHPLYVLGDNNTFGGSSDPKITSRGVRTFIANKGNMAYMGIVYNAGAAEAAAALSALGMDNAMGLDQGGSTALWYGGYKAGPGRGLPSAVLFVRR